MFLDTHNGAPQSVVLLWTSDHFVAETSTWQHTTLTTDKYPCPRWDSNPRSQQVSGHRLLVLHTFVVSGSCRQPQTYVKAEAAITVFELLMMSGVSLKTCWAIKKLYFFYCGAATQRGSWPPHSWGFLDHTQRRTTVGRTPLDEWSARHRDLYLTTHNTHNRQTSMSRVGFEPTISAGERPQTYALDRAARYVSK